MNEIKILPIFDQSIPGIWDDFLHIRATTMVFNYKYKLSPEDLTRLLSEYTRDHNLCAYNFAFAAYDKTEMIGFIRGNVSAGVATIKCLYVMPLYQHRHIGHRLLERAERSIAPVCTRVELISLGAAENFYKLHNYATIYGGNTYVKNLVMSHCVDIPLFGYTACVKRMCANLMSDSDWYAVAKSHLPSFAYIGAGGHVDGIGLLCADTTASIVLRATNDWAHKCLGRTLDKYRADILHRTKVL